MVKKVTDGVYIAVLLETLIFTLFRNNISQCSRNAGRITLTDQAGELSDLKCEVGGS